MKVRLGSILFGAILVAGCSGGSGGSPQPPPETGNTAPIATSQSLIAEPDTTYTGMLSASDADNDSLSFSITKPAANGTVTLSGNSNQVYTYTPDAGYSGLDSFEFVANDGTTNSPVAAIEFTLNARPVVESVSVETATDTPVTSQVRASDKEGDALTLTITDLPTLGTITAFDSSTGVFTYAPNSQASGTDTFRVTATDGLQTSAPIAVAVTVDTWGGVRQFGSNGDDVVATDSFYIDADGGFVIGGFTDGVFSGPAIAGGTDAWVASFDPRGNERWRAQYGDTERNSSRAVRPDPVGGGTIAVTRAEDRTVLIVRYDSNGFETQRFGITYETFSPLFPVYRVEVDSFGDVYLLDWLSTVSALVTKIDGSNGSILWQTPLLGTFDSLTLDTPLPDDWTLVRGRSIEVADDGSVLVGLNFSPDQNSSVDRPCAFCMAGVRLSSSGEITSVTELNDFAGACKDANADSIMYSLVDTDDGSLLAAGHTVDSSTDVSAQLTRYTGSGDQEWTFCESNGSGLVALFSDPVIAANGDFIIHGSRAIGSDPVSGELLYEGFATRLTRDGSVVFQQAITGTRADGQTGSVRIYGLAEDNDGFLFVAGSTDAELRPGTALGERDAFLLRLGSDGSLQNSEPPALTLGINLEEIQLTGLALTEPVVREYEITTTSGAPFDPQEVAVALTAIEGGNWLNAEIVDIDGAPSVRITVDRVELQSQQNGVYRATVRTISTNEQLDDHTLNIIVTLALTEPFVIIGGDIAGEERTTIEFNAATSVPQFVQSVNWEQVDGTPNAVLLDRDSFKASAVLPEVDVSTTLTFRITVSYATGQVVSDDVVVSVIANANISELSFADPAFAACVNAAATANGWVESVEVDALDCTGISSIDGIAQFSELRDLSISGAELRTIRPLIASSIALDSLNVSGSPNLICTQIDTYADLLVEGDTFLAAETCFDSLVIELSADENAYDIEIDDARNQIYVSIPGLNEVQVVSTVERRIVDRIRFQGSPYGIDLSIDGSRLFVAQPDTDSIAEVLLDTRDVRTIALRGQAGQGERLDVAEVRAGLLAVAGGSVSCCSNDGFLATVDLADGDRVTRIATRRFSRTTPRITRSADQEFFYIAQDSSTPDILKFSLTSGAVVEAQSLGSAPGFRSSDEELVLSRDGSRITYQSGDVLRSGALISEGSIGQGFKAAASNSDEFISAERFDGQFRVRFYDSRSLVRGLEQDTTCRSSTLRDFGTFGGDSGFAFLTDRDICLSSTVRRADIADPFADFRFSDLALEECVIRAVSNGGFTTTGQIVNLDCSANTRGIISLEGIERLANLRNLAIPGGSIIDLSPLVALDGLVSINAVGSGIRDARPLLNIPSLAFLNLTNNPAISCSILDEIGSTKNVVANRCTASGVVELAAIGTDIEIDPATNTALVAIPDAFRLDEIDLESGQIIRSLPVTEGEPTRFVRSSDGQSLYISLDGIGSLGVMNLATLTTEVIDTSAQLTTNRVGDVIEYAPGIVLLTHSDFFDPILRIDLNNGGAIAAVNGGGGFGRGLTTFARSPGGDFMFVGSRNDNRILILDATSSALPSIAQVSLSGSDIRTDNLVITPDGSRIYLPSGNVLDASEPVLGGLPIINQVTPGLSTLARNGTQLLVGREDIDEASRFDILNNEAPIGFTAFGCDIRNLTAIREFESGILVLGDDLVCFTTERQYTN